MAEVMARNSALDGSVAVVVTPEVTAEQPGAYGTGWIRDWPDFRDYTAETPKVKAMLKDLGVAKASAKAPALPATVDMRGYFSPIENQGAIGSCTAHAGVGVLEYFERRGFGNHVDASRLFLYKVTRDLLGWTGDTGAFLRSTMGAMALFGVPPEKYWPYDVAKYDVEPTRSCTASGRTSRPSRTSGSTRRARRGRTCSRRSSRTSPQGCRRSSASPATARCRRRRQREGSRSPRRARR